MRGDSSIAGASGREGAQTAQNGVSAGPGGHSGRRLSTERLVALQEHCAEQAASRIAAECWLDLAAAVAEVLETRRLIRELADWYETLLPVIRSGDRERIDRMLELGRKVGQ